MPYQIIMNMAGEGSKEPPNNSKLFYNDFTPAINDTYNGE